jgi:hypothetical protein
MSHVAVQLFMMITHWAGPHLINESYGLRCSAAHTDHYLFETTPCGCRGRASLPEIPRFPPPQAPEGSLIGLCNPQRQERDQWCF